MAVHTKESEIVKSKFKNAWKRKKLKESKVEYQKQSNSYSQFITIKGSFHEKRYVKGERK